MLGGTPESTGSGGGEVATIIPTLQRMHEPPGVACVYATHGPCVRHAWTSPCIVWRARSGCLLAVRASRLEPMLQCYSETWTSRIRRHYRLNYHRCFKHGSNFFDNIRIESGNRLRNSFRVVIPCIWSLALSL